MEGRSWVGLLRHCSVERWKAEQKEKSLIETLINRTVSRSRVYWVVNWSSAKTDSLEMCVKANEVQLENARFMLPAMSYQTLNHIELNPTAQYNRARHGINFSLVYNWSHVVARNQNSKLSSDPIHTSNIRILFSMFIFQFGTIFSLTSMPHL